MNGIVDTPDDWTILAAEWQDAAPTVTVDDDALRNRVEADRRRMRRTIAAEVGVSLVAVAIVIVTMQQYPGSWSRFLAFDTLAMLVALWVFGIWNVRGTWQPLGESTEAYIGLTRLRCDRRLNALWYAGVVTVLQIVAVLAWSQSPGSSGGAPTLPDIALLLPSAVVATVAVSIVVSRRRIRRELAELDALSLELRSGR